MLKSLVVVGVSLVGTSNCLAMDKTVDCSEAYGTSATCEIESCDEKYLEFIGTWTGPFLSYVQDLSSDDDLVFRPFTNTVTYSESDCLRNIVNDDVFIIGRRSDHYPEFKMLPEETKAGLIVTGRKADSTPFLRTIDSDNGVNDYQLVYKNKPANLSIWQLTIPSSGENPEMRFTTIDGKDWSVRGVHKRNVAVTMSIGPDASPYWEHVIAKGFHSLQE